MHYLERMSQLLWPAAASKRCLRSSIRPARQPSPYKAHGFHITYGIPVRFLWIYLGKSNNIISMMSASSLWADLVKQLHYQSYYTWCDVIFASLTCRNTPSWVIIQPQYDLQDYSLSSSLCLQVKRLIFNTWLKKVYVEFRRHLFWHTYPWTRDPVPLTSQ
jgi:hypothetical protein